MMASFSFLHFYLDLFFVSVVPALLNFGSTYSSFPHHVALSWKAVFVGRLVLRIYMTQTAPVFFRTTHAHLLLDWANKLFPFSASPLKLAITLSNDYLMTILMFSSSPSNVPLLPYTSSCSGAGFMYVCWLFMFSSLTFEVCVDTLSPAFVVNIMHGILVLLF